MARHRELRELFRQMLDGLGKMSKVLEEEARCLARRDPEALEQAASKKQKLAARLNDLVARQNGCLQAYGSPPDGRGLDTFLQGPDFELPDAESLRADWQEIVRLGLVCRKQNELNGAYIGLLLRHVDASLNFLHGVSSADATYGPNGMTRRGDISRRSFSA